MSKNSWYNTMLHYHFLLDSYAVISLMRRRCLFSPLKKVLSQTSAILFICAIERYHSDNPRTFASLCNRDIFASCVLVTVTARIPLTLFAAIATPSPLPHTKIPFALKSDAT